MTQFTANNYAMLQQVLNTGAGVIGVNLPWFAATTDCTSGCNAQEPSNPSSSNDPVYENSPAVQVVDQITSYVQAHGNGAIVMAITFGTPGWAACSGDPSNCSPYVYIACTKSVGLIHAEFASPFAVFACQSA
ncbi:MAG: hypothetical protein M1339_02365 [Bacteroidetes bacterium]|nr:hypothetical protein [Bacteroidota bacterium]